MRNVTRTTSRNRDDHKDTHNNKKYRRNQPESESEDESEESEDNDEDIDSDDGKKQDNEKSMAYNALLTLLKHDHQSEDEEEDDEEEEDAQSKDIDNDDDRDEENKLLEEVEDNAIDDEEEEDVLVEEDLHEDENSINNKYDSFNLHFNDEDKIEKYCDFYEKKLKEIKSNNKKEKILKLNNRLKLDQSNYLVLDYKYDLKLKDNDLILDDKYSKKTATALPSKLKYHNVKLRVQEQFNKIFNTNIEKELELELIESLLSYENINFQYYNQDLKFKERYQDYYLLHCINHLYKTRDRILNNNEKKTKYLKQIEEGLIEEKNDESLEDGLNFRDQGYTRPKILILLPTRNYAYKLVNKLINLY
ncbi:unnamed protein product [[Candida] boidinii]|uniref:Unnamed protein product n=1 Tax=Candida boidinii TaxID=5477 RepID=A0A9W6T618_CANBO|nr:unnamed protein product [[Candida] boidinii]